MHYLCMSDFGVFVASLESGFRYGRYLRGYYGVEFLAALFWLVQGMASNSPGVVIVILVDPRRPPRLALEILVT